jgi:hypothetical protein
MRAMSKAAPYVGAVVLIAMVAGMLLGMLG